MLIKELYSKVLNLVWLMLITEIARIGNNKATNSTGKYYISSIVLHVKPIFNLTVHC